MMLVYRDVIHEHSMWPSFLGNRLALEAQCSKDEKAASSAINEQKQTDLKGAALAWTLPAMLWPEQQRFSSLLPSLPFESNLVCCRHLQRLRMNDERRVNKKRRLPENDEEEGEGEEAAHASKRAKSESTAGLLGSVLRISSGFLAFCYYNSIGRLFAAPAVTEVEHPMPAEALPTAAPAAALPVPAALCFRDRVHDSLRSQPGYVLGGGDVYGGDYTIYKDGDPSTTHSLATVRIHQGSSVAVKDVLAFSRVQNQVAKAAVLAFEDQRPGSAGKVRFLAFNFRGVSNR